MAKSGVKAKVAAERGGGSLPALIGFAAAVLPMAALLFALWMAPLPEPLYRDVPQAAEAAEAGPETGVIYVDLPEPLMVATAANQPRVQIALAVALKGDLLKLAALGDEVLAKSQPLSAEMLSVAQQMVAEGADSDMLHRDLPERLRAVINGAIGTEDWPEPVAEVLFTSLALQG